MERGRKQRIVDAMWREIYPISMLAILAGVIFGAAQYTIVVDTWLPLLGGRELIDSGFATSNTWTVLGAGEQWLNQQWLSHLGMHALYDAGGIRAVMLVNAVLVIATYTLAVIAARRLGGSPIAVALMTAVVIIAAPWAWQARSQALAYPLFIVLVWLLIDTGRQTAEMGAGLTRRQVIRRASLAAAVLIVWANAHGSVLLAVVVIALWAVVRALQQRTVVAVGSSAAVVVGAGLLVLVTPYGLDIVDYYRSLLGNDALTSIVREWNTSLPSRITAGFYALAIVAVAIVVRARHRSEWFSWLLLLALFVQAVDSLRGIVWFALAALVLLPDLATRPAIGDVLLDAARRQDAVQRWWVAGALATTLVVAATAAFTYQAARPGPVLSDRWPDELIAAVDEQVPPGAVIAADESVADWIMVRSPDRVGDLGWDIRYEVLDDDTLRDLADYRAWSSDASEALTLPVDDARYVIIDTTNGDDRVAELSDRGWTTLAVHGQYVLIANQRSAPVSVAL